MHDLNWLAIVAAAVSAFVLGGLWYGPLFKNAWCREAGIDPKRPAVTYCLSGGRAAVMAFTLELMGGDKVRNYYRSWAEWGNAENTPIEKAPKK